MQRDKTKGKRKSLPVGIPLTWNESKDYTVAIFVRPIQKALARKTDIKSLMLVSHQQFNQLCTDEQPGQVFTELCLSKEEGIDEIQETDDITQEILTDYNDPSYATSKSSTSQWFSQPKLNDLVRDLEQIF